MRFEPGGTVLHYRIVEKIGEGGMGQVWRAVDTTLDRDVAIKVLPAAFAGDADRLARFEQEAKLLALLNHPNIAAVYSVHDHEGERFLAMELVEGEDLADRLARGPIPVDEAARLAVQIAEALEVAHDGGVIHRDLKPANILITPAGKAKVLDFGLAKALAGPAGGSDPSLSPTMTSAGTLAGMILGTAAYMSPEQARGQEVDRRADVWSFGVVLLEMLIGKTVFHGQTVSDTLASVLKTEPDWEALPDDTPLPIRRVLRRCLNKDADRRMPHIAAARIELREWLDGTIETEEAPTAGALEAPPPPSALARWLPWALVAVLAVAGAAAWLRPGGPDDAGDAQQYQLLAPFPPDRLLTTNQMGALAVSPDGRRLAIVLLDGGDEVLYLRDLGENEFRRIDGSFGGSTPFFSPDGQWVGFFAGNALKKVHVEGGAPISICDVSGNNRGATWSSDDRIYFEQHYNEGLSVVSAGGGEIESVTTLDESVGERTHRWPQLLPGGTHLLFTVGSLDSPESYDGANIDVVELSSGKRTTVWRGAAFARYLPSGHLVFAREGFVFAVRFDLESLEAQGTPVPVVEHVAGMSSSGVTHITFADNGLVAYIRGEPQNARSTLTMFFRDGRPERTLKTPQARLVGPRFSPDDRHLAMAVAGEQKLDIWTLDVKTEIATRQTFVGNNDNVAWSPDGKQLAFSSSRGGLSRPFVKPLDGSADAREVQVGLDEDRSVGDVLPTAWSEQGLLLTANDRKGTNIFEYSEERGELRALTDTSSVNVHARRSPDGKWLLYSSDESGRFEVYVRSIEGAGSRRQVSRDGGFEPYWTSGGREIVYRWGRQVWVVGVDPSDGFRVGQPKVWLDSIPAIGTTSSYHVSSDGQELVMIYQSGDHDADGVTVVLNWLDELKRRVP